MKNEEEVLNDWRRIDSESIAQICNLVKKYEHDVQDYLADIVSSLCDMSTEEMMTKEDRVRCNHARWLFWYAYRHMTNDTFEHLSQISERYGRKFTLQGINAAVNKMSALIVNNTIWTKRWTVLKRIIKTRNKSTEIDFGQPTQLPNDKVFVNIPRELKSKIEIKYND